MSIGDKVTAVTDWMKPEERISIVNKDYLAKYHIILHLSCMGILLTSSQE